MIRWNKPARSGIKSDAKGKNVAAHARRNARVLSIFETLLRRKPTAKAPSTTIAIAEARTEWVIDSASLNGMPCIQDLVEKNEVRIHINPKRIIAKVAVRFQNRCLSSVTRRTPIPERNRVDLPSQALVTFCPPVSLIEFRSQE